MKHHKAYNTAFYNNYHPIRVEAVSIFYFSSSSDQVLVDDGHGKIVAVGLSDFKRTNKRMLLVNKRSRIN